MSMALQVLQEQTGALGTGPNLHTDICLPGGF